MRCSRFVRSVHEGMRGGCVRCSGRPVQEQFIAFDFLRSLRIGSSWGDLCVHGMQWYN